MRALRALYGLYKSIKSIPVSVWKYLAAGGLIIGAVIKFAIEYIAFRQALNAANTVPAGRDTPIGQVGKDGFVQHHVSKPSKQDMATNPTGVAPKTTVTIGGQGTLEPAPARPTNEPSTRELIDEISNILKAINK